MASTVSTRIRRLRSPDLNTFRGLQRYAAHFEHSQALHNRWVEKAIREIKEGERIGYGLFDLNGNPPQLLGSILLRCTSSNVIELKNLVVRPSVSPMPQARTQAYKDLVSRAELASIYRGFSRLEIELLSLDYEQIELFLSLGYAIQPSHESAGIPHYLLWKHVRPEYHGDPFDHLSMARWLFTERLHWSVEPEPERIVFGANDEQLAFRLRFDVPWLSHFGVRARRDRDGTPPRGLPPEEPAANPNTQGETDFESNFRITGDCIVDSGMGDVADFTALLQREEGLEQPSVRFILSTRQLKGLQETARRAGFRPVFGSDLLRMIGYSKATEPFALDKDAVQGVLLYVGPSDISALRKLCTSGTSFSYVIFNGLGDAIYQGLAKDEEARFFAVFCTDSAVASSEAKQVAVVAWAQVEDAVPRRFDLVEEELRDRDTLWRDKSEIKFFVNPFNVNFQENDVVYVLHLKSPRLLEDEAPLYEIAAEDAALRPLLADDQFDGFSACYIEKLGSSVRMREYKEWEDAAPPETPVESTIGVELLARLQDSLTVIGASQWLRSIIYQEFSTDATAELPALQKEIETKRSTLERAQKELASQQDLFAFPGPPILASQLRDTLRSVRSSFNEFWGQPEKNWHAKNLCARMRKALDLGRDLGLGVVCPEPLDRWLDTISRHGRIYSVGLTFSSQYRKEVVEPVANALAKELSEDRVFYDTFHQSIISRLAARELLSEIYLNECDLVVAFFSDLYGDGWTGMEWEKVRQLARAEPNRVLLIKLADVDGRKLGLDEASRDIIWDIRKAGGFEAPEEICKGILKRLDAIRAPEVPPKPRKPRSRSGGTKRVVRRRKNPPRS